MNLSNNESYVGDFKNDKFNGIGTYKFSNDAKYIGEWNNGKMHGNGMIINK